MMHILMQVAVVTPQVGEKVEMNHGVMLERGNTYVKQQEYLLTHAVTQVAVVTLLAARRAGET